MKVGHSPVSSHFVGPSRTPLSNAIVGNKVGASILAASDASGAKRLDTGSKCGRAVDVLAYSKVESKAGNMGACHRGSSKGASGAGRANIGGDNIGARGQDINGGAVVRVGILDPVVVDGTDSDGLGGGSRRTVGCRGVLITRGDNGEDPVVEGRSDSRVESGRVGTA